MKRRHRLSRSRDFDAVYRHGRSVSTRYIVLYAFPRETSDGPRLGLAISRQVGGAVVRNRLRRQLRAALDGLLPQLSPTNDYVLIARPGLAEGAQTQGAAWLREQLAALFTQARASTSGAS